MPRNRMISGIHNCDESEARLINDFAARHGKVEDHPYFCRTSKSIVGLGVPVGPTSCPPIRV